MRYFIRPGFQDILHKIFLLRIHETRIIKRFLKLINRKNKSIKVLDVGCGSGFYYNILSNLSSNIFYFGFDRSKLMVKVSKKKHPNGYFFVCKASSFNSRKKFDVILLIGILEFNPLDYEKIIINLFRYLKKPGVMVITITKKSFIGFLYFLYHRLVNQTSIRLFSFRETKKIFQKICDGKIKILNSFLCKIVIIER